MDQTALPDDVASCHARIRRLEAELSDARRQLAIHQENERQRMEYIYGKGATAEKLLAVGERFAGVRVKRSGGKK